MSTSNTVTKNDLKAILEELPLIQQATDFIVEQGTSGIWTYRKWNSGIAECWGEHTATLSPYQQVFGGYGFNTSVNFPSGLFNAYPQVKYSAAISNSTAGYGFALTGTITSALSKNSVTLYAVCNINSSCSTVWMVEAKGRWK